MSSIRPLVAARPHGRIAALLVIAALSACTAAQDRGGVSEGDHASPIESGEVVTSLGEHMRVVFQSSDGARWFGSGDQGVYRFDGQRIVRFGQEHGLGGSQVWSIQEDRSGNVYVCAYPGGISRFDGRTFSTLSVADPSTSQWKLSPDDLWFPAGQDTGAVYRYDGEELHRLALPRTERGEASILPRSQYPNAKYLPYDVYTTFRDSKGHVWFGTATLGACRYDGTSFLWVDSTELGYDRGDASFGVRSIIEDKDGNLWFSNTLNRFDVRPTAPAERGTAALGYRKEPGLGDESDPYSLFMSAVRDRNGDLLLATLGAGVWRYDGARWTRYPVKHSGTDIWVFSIYIDRQDTLWLATQEHGVYRFNGESFEQFKP